MRFGRSGYAKKANVPTAKKAPEAAGDIWTWVALDPDTKLVPSYFVGRRDLEHAYAFIGDLKDRLANRVQLTSDGHRPYLTAIPETFKGKIDYAVLVKFYDTPKDHADPTRRYSPGQCTGLAIDVITGKPDPKKITTSHAERQNLTMRMSMRRFTRLTNAFSKKAQNHIHAVSLHFMHYNFCRIHQSLRITPAMAAGIADRLWDVVDIVRLIEDAERVCPLP
jgi:IS1 family transposase